LEQVVASLQINEGEDSEDTEGEDYGTWVAVKKKGSKSDPPTRNEASKDDYKDNDTLADNPKEDASSEDLEQEKCLEEKPKQTEIEDRDENQADNAIGSYISTAIQPSAPNSRLDPPEISLPSFEGAPDDEKLQETTEERFMIRLLEIQLAQKEQQLQDERQAHAKAMQKEKERCDDLIQAFQLRLYISETRLKTYQDALEHHVEAVASNLSNNFTPSSPMRRGRMEKRQSSDPPSSPLISRVLIQQNRFEE
jgi:hypothetical protein